MHDKDYWLKREAEARAAAARRGDDENADIAGHLALAYASLARRKTANDATEQPLLIQQ